jgi:hypothetical protein
MLDQAFGLTSTSRLGCQIVLESKHDGMVVKIPAATRNFYVVCKILIVCYHHLYALAISNDIIYFIPKGWSCS